MYSLAPSVSHHVETRVFSHSDSKIFVKSINKQHLPMQSFHGALTMLLSIIIIILPGGRFHGMLLINLIS